MEATIPDRRRLGHVLHTLDRAGLDFMRTAMVHLLRATLTSDEQATFGAVIASDKQALLAWVTENDPKQYIPEGQLDKNRQLMGDPDCKRGVKRRSNATPTADGDEPPTLTTDAHPANRLQVGVDIFWGDASGIVVTRLPDGTESGACHRLSCAPLRADSL